MFFAFNFAAVPFSKNQLFGWLLALLCTCSISVSATELNTKLHSAFRQGNGSKRDGSFSVTTRQGSTTLKTASLQETCVLCDSATLCYTARLLGAKKAIRESETLPSLELRLFPPNTEVWADGWQLPPFQQIVSLEPGNHLIVATRNNVTTHVSLSMEPNRRYTVAKKDLSFSHLHRPLFTLGIIALATGSALLGSGIALWAIDGKCASSQYNATQGCTDFHHTDLAGGILVGTASIFTVTGIVLLLIRAHKQKREKRVFFSKVERANGFTHP